MRYFRDMSKRNCIYKADGLGCAWQMILHLDHKRWEWIPYEFFCDQRKCEITEDEVFTELL